MTQTLALLERAFVRIAAGLVHYRHAGPGHPVDTLPLFMSHPAPGSSARISELIERLGTTHCVIAPDTLGHGDSAPPTVDKPELAYYADSVVETMDALGLERVDFVGSHAGAFIGVELALRHPRRLRRIVLDSIAVFPDELRRLLYERYAPSVTSDDFGLHLGWAWQFIKDQKLHWPYFLRDPAHRLSNPVPSADTLHGEVMELLKSLTTYHHLYRAVWRQDIGPRLAQIRDIPLLLMAAEADPLHPFLDAAAACVPAAQKVSIARAAGIEGKSDAIREFLLQE